MIEHKIPKEIPVRNPSIVSRKIDDEYILVPIRQNVGDLDSIFTLNEVGAFIWELIDGTRGTTAIREALVKEFDVTPERAEADLEYFLGRLTETGTLEAE
jgi:hypothetical protein